MRSLIFSLLVTAAVAGCNRFDPMDDARAEAAVVAGGIALSTLNKCLVHMEQTTSTAIPECDAGEKVQDYLNAKQRVKNASAPALRSLDERIEAARAEAEGAVIRIVMQGRDKAARPPG
jgi:hypothetical protein